jgi:cold shock CspA family protein
MSSTTDSVTQSAGTNASERFTGRVKWFNNKAGYGFISITDGTQAGNDVFVHHSAIGVSSEQYKYLVQGEYISFTLSPTQNDTHKFQATSVLGINGGKLMCETRRDFKMSRTTYNKDKIDESSEPVKMSRQTKVPSSASAPASTDSSKKPRQYKDKQPKTIQQTGEWTTVVKGKKPRT